MSSSKGASGRHGAGTRQAAAAEAWQALFQLFFAGVGQRRFHEACDATGLAPGALKTLLQLDPDEPVPMRDLAGVFRCDPSYVTSLVDTLEEAGLAERQLHPTDRRVRVVALTEQGVDTKAAVHTILDQPPESFATLTESELLQLRDTLLKLGAEPASSTPEPAAATG